MRAPYKGTIGPSLVLETALTDKDVHALLEYAEQNADLVKAAQDVMKVLGFLLYSPKDGDTYRVIFNLSKALGQQK